MRESDSTTFYVRTHPHSMHVKQVFTTEMAVLDHDQPAIEIDLSIYGKNDSKIYDLSDNVQQFVDELSSAGVGDSKYFEKVFVVALGTGVFIEVTLSSAYSWAGDCMNSFESAIEQLNGGEQVNFLPFEAITARTLAGTISR